MSNVKPTYLMGELKEVAKGSTAASSSARWAIVTIHDLTARVSDLESQLKPFKQGVDHVNEKGPTTTRSMSTIDGKKSWAMVNPERLTDLEICEEKLKACDGKLEEVKLLLLAQGSEKASDSQTKELFDSIKELARDDKRFLDLQKRMSKTHKKTKQAKRLAMPRLLKRSRTCEFCNKAVWWDERSRRLCDENRKTRHLDSCTARRAHYDSLAAEREERSRQVRWNKERER